MKPALPFAFLLLLSSLSAAQTTPRPAITGISHVVLFADNLSKSREFYVSLVGWDPVPAGAAHSGVRIYANHSQYIELISPPRAGILDRLDAIYFSTSDASALRRYLGAHGVAVPAAVTRSSDGSRSFQVLDPEGNKVGFAQPGRHFPPEPADASRRLSAHILHAGYVVRNRAALDHFYKDILGFHLYWQGGAHPGETDWVMMQVPNGADWFEYMLNLPAQPSRSQLGSADHFAPGVVSVAQLQSRLERRGWAPPSGKNPQVLGVDGKMQLDLRDPDGTRVEFMEYLPVKQPCCSPYTGVQPSPPTGW